MNRVDRVDFKTDANLAAFAARLLLDKIEDCRRSGRPRFCLALSGGRIAQTFYVDLVRQAKSRACSFQEVHFFWADERCVPPEDKESNYRLASEHLLLPLEIPGACIHRIRGEAGPEMAAALASEELANWAARNPDGLPMIDFIILGLGEDGHTASLFPAEPVDFTEIQTLYRPVYELAKTTPQPRHAGLFCHHLCPNGCRPHLRSRQSERPQQFVRIWGETPLGRILHRRSSTKILVNIDSVSQ